MDEIVRKAAALSGAARREAEASATALASGHAPAPSRVAASVAELDELLWEATRLPGPGGQVAR